MSTGPDLDPCRPFTDDEPAEVKRAQTRPVGPPPPGAVSELELAIDRAMLWADRHLVAIIRLAHWQPYLSYGGHQHIVAERVMYAAADMKAAAGELDQVLEDLRRAALAVEGAA